MTIGQRIALKRKEQNLSQEALGERLGVSRQSVYKWESDAALPEIDKFVAMSRLFDVTVGWLLGVEEENPQAEGESAADSKAEQAGCAASDGGELNEDQLRMVQEIVDRYIAAQPKPPKKKRWPRVLAAVAAVILVWTLTKLNRELNVLNSRYNNLQNSISSVNSTVSGQISGIANRVEEILESQNSLLADYSVELMGMDIPGNTLTLHAEATPKTYVEGMEAVFSVDTGETLQEYPAALGEGHTFSSEITCELTDTTLVSVVFVSGDTRQTQLLKDYYSLYSSTFPDAYVETHDMLMWRDLDQNGNIVFDEKSKGDNYAWLAKTSSVLATDGSIEVAEVREIKVGFFKNRELVAWMAPCEQPDHYFGDWGTDQFYRMPYMTIVPEEGDLFTAATLVIDEYGREKLYMDGPFAVDREENWLDHADAFVKEDWYDPNTWTY